MDQANLPSQDEFLRIEEEQRYKAQNGLWRKWGPYLSERQWGTVREDYSPMAMPGNTCPTSTPAAVPIAGARTASPASATTSSGSACRWRCGTDTIRFSRSGFSD